MTREFRTWVETVILGYRKLPPMLKPDQMRGDFDGAAAGDIPPQPDESVSQNRPHRETPFRKIDHTAKLRFAKSTIPRIYYASRRPA